MKIIKILVLIAFLIILIVFLIKSEVLHLRTPGQPASKPSTHEEKKSEESVQTKEHEDAVTRIQYGDWRG